MNTTMQEVFDMWIEMANSNSTKDNYSREVKKFFKDMFGKEVDEVTEDDLLAMTRIDVQRNYIKPMMDEGYKNSTIKYKTRVVSGFFEQLSVNRVYNKVNYEAIVQNTLNTKSLRDDSENYNKASEQDVQGLKNWLANERFKDSPRGVQYSVLVDFMTVTGSRLAETFKVTWNDIKLETDSQGVTSWVVHVIGKGDKLNKNPITDEFYDYLKENLYNGNDEEELFSKLSEQNFSRLVTEYGKTIGKDIKTHSLRRYTATKLYNQTKDLVLTQRFMGHESVETTISYLDDSDETHKQGSYILSSREARVEDLEGLSKEELLELIGARPDTLNTLVYEAKQKNLIEG